MRKNAKRLSEELPVEAFRLADAIEEINPLPSERRNDEDPVVTCSGCGKHMRATGFKRLRSVVQSRSTDAVECRPITIDASGVT
jgi:hypothetical protein